MKSLYAFTCLIVIAAIGLFVVYGTVSPCEIAKGQIRTYILAEAMSDGDSISAVLGAALSDGLAEAQLNSLLKGDVRPLKCAEFIYQFETRVRPDLRRQTGRQ